MEQIRQRIEKLKQKQKGFTLVELIVVIAIIGILAGVLLPKYFGFTDQARQAAAISDAKSIRSIAETYEATYGVWPNVTLAGTAATQGTNRAGVTGAGTSILTANTTAAPASTLTCPLFQGTIGVTSLQPLTTDGSFTYISDTGISLSCDPSGTITVNS